jgi:hypothetical protein
MLLQQDLRHHPAEAVAFAVLVDGKLVVTTQSNLLNDPARAVAIEVERLTVVNEC